MQTDKVWELIDVSIHVPTRGTTAFIAFSSIRNGVSIHVPTRGTTATVVCKAEANSSFNPRSHEGNDLFCGSIQRRSATVSSHVPTRGTTACTRRCLHIAFSFNPRSHEGNDQIPKAENRSRSQFQSTFPRGERRHSGKSNNYIVTVSIHVPTRGTTERFHRKPYKLPPFQSTFPRGERHSEDLSNLASYMTFQSTFPRGERRNKSLATMKSEMFQSTFPRGERRGQIS